MSTPRGLNVAFAVLTVLVASAGTVIGLGLIARTAVDIVPVGYRLAEMLPFVVLEIAFTAVGALLAWRRAGNLIGWLLCAHAVINAALLLLAGLVVRSLAAGDLPSAATAAWVFAWLMNALTVVLVPMLVLFPDGRLTSGVGGAALWATGVTVTLTTVSIVLRPGSLASFPEVENPYAWHGHGGILDVAFALGLATGAVGTVLLLWSQSTRFRRSSGVERQQLKWFVASLVLLMVALVPAIFLLYGESEPATSSAQRHAGRAIAALASTALPISIGVAIFRYRLYDIDLLINRALVYSAASAVLVGTYAAAVVLFQTLLRPFTSGSELAVAVSTLLVVALFQPIRGRVQDFVDRRFYRSRYDAARTLDAFSARLRNDVELESVRADLLGVIGDTVRPSHASVWLRGQVR